MLIQEDQFIRCGMRFFHIRVYNSQVGQFIRCCMKLCSHKLSLQYTGRSIYQVYEVVQTYICNTQVSKFIRCCMKLFRHISAIHR